MKRREFLEATIKAGMAVSVAGVYGQSRVGSWQTTWDAALRTLEANVRAVPHYKQPVLFEGSVYGGIWQECGPHESLAYAQLAGFTTARDGQPSALDVAKCSHRVFFAAQREDGQLPANVTVGGTGWGIVQMVVPIAATAWEVTQLAKDEAFLAEAYGSCARWDAWLCRYRMTRGTGLIEAFCAWDTGQDNSPRWAGVSNGCPDGDARKCPSGQSVPRLCPDISATVFGGRMALNAMAEALGKIAEAQKWIDEAERIRALTIEKLWCEEDASFYDVAPNGSFVRVRSVANLRVLGEHVLRRDHAREAVIFEELWKRQLHNSKSYWTTYPFPSIAIDDPKFVRSIPPNSWGGASQALTALRTLRWMEYYGKSFEQRILMERWCEAILRAGGFYQQMNPITGIFTRPDPGGYSPSALAFLHFAKRLESGSESRKNRVIQDTSHADADYFPWKYSIAMKK